MFMSSFFEVFGVQKNPGSLPGMHLQPAIEICVGMEFQQCLTQRFDAAEFEHAYCFFLPSGQRPQPTLELPQDQFGLPLLPPFLEPCLAPTVDTKFNEGIG
jgi:hypothetical protein